MWFYLDDRRRTLDSPVEKAMLAIQGMADEMERERARQRTYNALQRKARAGHVTGDQVFAYSNMDVNVGPDAHGRPIRSHVERRINDVEAAVEHASNLPASSRRPYVGRPLNGTAAKYLGTGLLQCGCCGATMEVRSRAHG